MVLGILSSLAPALFRFVEAKFRPKTGATKMNTVLQAVKVVLEALGVAGELGGPVPVDDELRAMLEKILTGEKTKPDWKESGVLEVGSKKYIVQILGEL